ncbi:TetR/AcrR family transcriptional regulator [Acidocella aromatica]|uniref:TetR/AcrR family transcriptional repressor of nem operon n=1 Tax=Acidocella aromatica TaxID=1303579 RepID=A0A840VF16_9PROT|nr:TetR/AcrR family transcriptional regulator [Acidocella aromatica]MBB5374428.1 TetR/AcrR family transcriptional repressor of nem operon [Acidocella aromatica]
MPRPRTLDDDALLDRARDLFWRKGYTATSLRDLTSATGLSGAALYNRFGDKAGLFREVLRRYADTGLSAERLPRLSALADPCAAITGFFTELLVLSLAPDLPSGCLLINTALDGGADEPETRTLVRDRLSEVEAFLRDQTGRAMQARLLPGDADPALTAEALFGAVLALRVLARLDPNPARLRRMVEAALTPLGLSLPTIPQY